jgi:hypothetical protein
LGDAEEVAEFRIVLAALDALNRGPVDLCAVGQLLLGEVGVHPSIANPSPQRLLGVGDPFGLVGGHPSNARRIMIVSQQLLCGFL